jgi:hypothetical protein
LSLEIIEDAFHRLAVRRSVGGLAVAHVTRFDGGQHGVLTNVGEVVGEPIDDAMRMLAKFIWCHIRFGSQSRKRFDDAECNINLASGTSRGLSFAKNRSPYSFNKLENGM